MKLTTRSSQHIRQDTLMNLMLDAAPGNHIGLLIYHRRTLILRDKKILAYKICHEGVVVHEAA